MARDGTAPARQHRYLEIVDALIDDLRTGTAPPGTRLATERDLARRFGVTRQTVRRALAVLGERGLVERRQGAGTFASAPRFDRAAGALFSFTETSRDLGETVEATLLEESVIEATRSRADMLDIDVASPVLFVRRVLSIRSTPLVVEVFHLPLARVPAFTTAELDDRSVYEALAQDHGVVAASADLSLEAIALDADAAHTLGVAAGAPAFREMRTTYDVAGRVVECGYDLYRGDRFRFATSGASRPHAVLIGP